MNIDNIWDDDQKLIPTIIQVIIHPNAVFAKIGAQTAEIAQFGALRAPKLRSGCSLGTIFRKVFVLIAPQ